MKKTFVIFFTLVYLVLSFGLTQYSHYCKELKMNVYSFVENSIQSVETSCPNCLKKNKEKVKDCCKYEVNAAKVDNIIQSYSGSGWSIQYWGKLVCNDTLEVSFDLLNHKMKEIKPSYIFLNIPVKGTLLYILHCVFRI